MNQLEEERGDGTDLYFLSLAGVGCVLGVWHLFHARRSHEGSFICRESFFVIQGSLLAVIFHSVVLSIGNEIYATATLETLTRAAHMWSFATFPWVLPVMAEFLERYQVAYTPAFEHSNAVRWIQSRYTIAALQVSALALAILGFNYALNTHLVQHIDLRIVYYTSQQLDTLELVIAISVAIVALVVGTLVNYSRRKLGLWLIVSPLIWLAGNFFPQPMDVLTVKVSEYIFFFGLISTEKEVQLFERQSLLGQPDLATPLTAAGNGAEM